jgi:hypothetical protein
MEETRGPGCQGAGTSKESDATVVDCDSGYTECGHATVVAELADRMSERDARKLEASGENCTGWYYRWKKDEDARMIAG